MVALNNISSTSMWGDTVDVAGIPNLGYYDSYSDTTGYANTSYLIQEFPAPNTYAANRVDFANGWFIPTGTQWSLLGLNWNYIKSVVLSNGGDDLATDFYWASTEYNKQNGIVYYVAGGVCYYLDKRTDNYVRAIRSFTNKVIQFDSTLTYLWSTGDTLPYIRVNPTTTTTYSLSVSNKYGCTDYAQKTIFVGDNQTEIIYDSICEGSVYASNGFNETTSGTYSRIATGSNGCSLTIELNLTVFPKKQTLIYDTTCVKKEYNKYGFYYSVMNNPGDFTDSATYVSSHGCDSTVILNLHVLPGVKKIIKDSICQGESYSKYGFSLTEQKILGSYLFQRTRTNTGSYCDSTYELQLKVNPSSYSMTNAYICSGDSYMFNGVRYSKGGIYSADLTNVYGCDSLAILKVFENKTNGSITNDTICLGDSIIFNGIKYTAAGTYIKHLTNALGCDSTATLKLVLKYPTTFSFTQSICEGQTYTFNGTDYSVAGTYSAKLTNAVGCDSTVTLQLKLIKPKVSYLKATIAYGDSYYFKGQYLTQAGVYRDSVLSSQNCDSILILTLSVDKSVIIPDVFTPNGDGVNDYFVIKNLELYPKNKIFIFNRWGNKVWQGGPYLNNWDGTDNLGITIGGNKLPVGTYFYILDLGDGSEVKKGYIYLNR
jgi:gliding motility-associated-like protein